MAKNVTNIDDLTPDTRNANKGTERGRYMVEQSLREAGAGRSIVVDKNGNVIAGNKTLEAAEALDLGIEVIHSTGDRLVVVQRDDLDLDNDDRARKLAYYDNRAGEVGLDWDAQQLAADLEEGLDLSSMFFENEIAAMLEQAADEILDGAAEEDEEGGAADAFSEIAEELSGAMMLKPDMRFPSDAPYGIPELRADRLLEIPADTAMWPGDDLCEALPKDVPGYFLIYSTSCRRLDFTRAIMAFYTDDSRFESIWVSPDKMATRMLNAGFLGCVTPNYSLWPDQAAAVRIFNTYRARWIGRYFQEAGIDIIPDVNWSGAHDYEFCFAGIPVGAPCISIQVQTFNARDVDEVARVRDGIHTALDTLRPEMVLFYGSKAGRALIEEEFGNVNRIVLPTLMDYRREKMTNRKV